MFKRLSINFNKIDMFSVSKNMNSFGKEKFQSTLGGVFSIILIFYLVFKFANLIILILSKEKFTTNLTNLRNKHTNVTIQDFRLSLCFSKEDYVNIREYDENYVKIDASMINRDGGSFDLVTDKIGLTSGECRTMNWNETIYEHFDRTLNIEAEYNKCYCVNSRNATLIANSVTGIYRYLEIQIHPQNTNGIQHYNPYIRFTTNYFDYHNTTQPFQSFTKIIYDIFNSNGGGYRDLYVDLLSYTDDSFKFDFFESEGTQNYSYQVNDNSINAQAYGTESYNYFVYSFSASNLWMKHEVTLFNIDDMLAIFGGYFQILHFLFTTICNTYNNYSMDREIIRILSNQFNDLQLIKKNFFDKIDLEERNDSSNISEIRLNKCDIKQNSHVISFDRLTNTKRKSVFNLQFEKADSEINFVNVNTYLFEKLADFKILFEIYSDVEALKSIVIENKFKEYFDLSKFRYIYGLHDSLIENKLNFKEIELASPV